MKKGKLGFTLIEVALFLAISGLLFLGVTLGVQSSIYQQRKNDSVQSFVEFLRTTYDNVENVRNNVQQGRSEMAIYGRLVTFGESYNLAGQKNENDEIFTYTVVGNIGGSQSGSGALDLLSNAKVTVKDEDDKVQFAGYAESYTPRWSAQIQSVCGAWDTSCRQSPMKGMMLVVRHPQTGVVFTYYSNNLVEINKQMEEKKGTNGDITGLEFNSDIFKLEQIDFCVNFEPTNPNARRTDVRIANMARNASAIEMTTDEESRCN